MDTCTLISVLIVLVVVSVIVFAIIRAFRQPTSSPTRQRFEYCPSCDVRLSYGDQDCPECGIDLFGKLASRLERMRFARLEIRQLQDEGELEAETAGRVTEQLRLRKRTLLSKRRPSVEQPSRERDEARSATPPASVEPIGPRVEREENLAPAVPSPPPLPQSPRPARYVEIIDRTGEEAFPPEPPRASSTADVRAPRRSFGQVMHERNILWGELAGGLLIVGCSIALVLSLWRTLEELPYFTFLLSAGITSAVFGAGYYTFHHWKLAGTSRGLLVISLLLTPLNLLLLADPGARGNTELLDIGVKIVAVLAFAWIARTGGRDLIELDGKQRRWWLALAVVGAPASQMIPLSAFTHQAAWMPVVCFSLACAFTVGWLSRSRRKSDAEALHENSAASVLMFVGIAVFGLFAAWGFVISRADELASTLRHLALPTAIAGVPILSAGLLVQRWLKEPVGLRATGTGVAVAGMIVLFASMVLAWPDPGTLLLSASAVGLLLAWMAYRDELPWMYAGAIPSFALAVILGFQFVNVGWVVPEDTNASQWLGQQITSAPSGGALAGFAILLLAGSELFVRRGRLLDARSLAIGSAGVALVGLLLVTVHGIEEPALAAIVHFACAIGFILASFRWVFRVVAHFGVWLLLLATMWSLWAIVPDERGTWGLVVSAEALILSTAALGLNRFSLVRHACRDVAATAGILALALLFSGSLRDATLSGTLFLLASTGFLLAGLYRLRELTWAGSLLGLVAFAHVLNFPLEIESWRVSLSLALLIHATLALVGALLLRRAVHRKVPDEVASDNIGHLTVHRSPALFIDPLRYSSRLTSCLIVPLLLMPVSGLAAAWAGFSAWTALLWLLSGLAWKERGTFPAFQALLTWTAGLLGFAWIETRQWYPSPMGVIDPRALQAYGVMIAFLSIGWEIARRALRHIQRARELWAELDPSLDRIVLAVLVVGQLLLAGIGVFPHVIAELTPSGANPAFYALAEGEHVWGEGAWLLLACSCMALVLAFLRESSDSVESESRSPISVVAFTLLALTVPFLMAGRFAPELASASALRWGLALVFLIGSAVAVFREQLAGLGLKSLVSPWSPACLRGLLAGGAAIVLLLTMRVAALGLSGLVPSGPIAESVFREIGWTASVMVPLAMIVIGLAGTALRERSSGYAFAGGLIWIATIAGGYALGVVTTGGALDATEQVRGVLLAIAAGSVWSLAWLAFERRIPGQGLLTATIGASVAGLSLLCFIALVVLVTFPFMPFGWLGSRELGREGWVVLALALTASVWHMKDRWRIHVAGGFAFLAGVLLSCSAQPWDVRGDGLSFHVLGAAWALAGIGMLLVPQRFTSKGLVELWVQLFGAGLILLAMRAGWSDPWRWAPPTLAIVATLFHFACAVRLRSLVLEYVCGLSAMVVGLLMWVAWGPASFSSLSMSFASALAIASVAFALWRAVRRKPPGEVSDANTRRLTPLGSPLFAHVGSIVSLALLLFGLIPTLHGAEYDPPLLAWGSLVAVGCACASLWKDREARFQFGCLYVVGVAAIGLAVAGFRTGPVWLDWPTPLALGIFILAASGFATLFRSRKDPGWLLGLQTLAGLLVLGMSIRTAVAETEFEHRLVAPAAGMLMLLAGLAHIRRAGAWESMVRQITLILGAIVLGLLAWAIPDPAGDVPWLDRHAGLFVALTATAALYLNVRSSKADFRRMGGAIGALALVALLVVLVQQIPQFDPIAKRTPLDPIAVGAVLVGMFALIFLAIQCALRPERDPFGPSTTGRTAYVYLAEILLVLVFAHVRLNVPQAFTGQAVRYWTFIVMLLAFVGVGLAELFARRGLRVLAQPLLRTGVLLPLIPLLAFWAKPPGMLMEYADAKAPGLRPMLGYLEKLPQHFDVYALLWLLAGMLYGLIALSRQSFGWALLGALATNAGLWALLSHNGVPAIVHPQAWAIPLALIVLVSEHVNRHRLKANVASGLRYLGISMIYVASASDLFIAGVGQSLWLPVILAALCVAGLLAGVFFRIRAFLYLGLGFLMLDVFSMIWHAAVNREQTWVWYASGIVLGAIILALFAVLEKRRNDVRDLIGKLREWN